MAAYFRVFTDRECSLIPSFDAPLVAAPSASKISPRRQHELSYALIRDQRNDSVRSSCEVQFKGSSAISNDELLDLQRCRMLVLDAKQLLK